MTRSLLFGSVFLLACARKPAPTVGVGHVTSGPPPLGVYVSAGQRATLRLDDALDSGTASAGKPFLAHVVDPLRDSDGRVIAAAGASVLGHVAEIDFGVAGAHMSLAFDRIETVQGVVPLAARIIAAERRTIPGEIRRAPSGATLEVPARVIMPAGARVTIALVRPIVLGAR